VTDFSSAQTIFYSISNHTSVEIPAPAKLHPIHAFKMHEIMARTSRKKVQSLTGALSETSSKVCNGVAIERLDGGLWDVLNDLMHTSWLASDRLLCLCQTDLLSNFKFLLAYQLTMTFNGIY
jgi:hypothetical protein